jgi:hypothetical protein
MTPIKELVWAARKFRESWDQVGLNHDSTIRWINEIYRIAGELDDGFEVKESVVSGGKDG